MNLCTLTIVLFVIVSTSVQAKLNKKFHLIVDQPRNWHDALHYCNSHGMRLAALYTEEESNELRKQLRELNKNWYFWTAGTCQGNEPYFYWMGHEKPMIYTNWGVNEPNNAFDREDCVELANHLDYKWNDKSCDHQLHTVCEEKLSIFPGEQSLHDSLSLRT